ncbi:TPA: Rgg/GadR/MutR family transcriptional regulator [Streptococcus equi subsp. zooepidemicus]|uniref:Putative DNA-binding protein n=2 Tax=Streptococcus equi TaxID=1336 RepID=C0ME69_STRS7|nr:Rgg/GadR/MutR family transcriptional regulator [Streptococcus equi subsp. zooepidemicus]MCD3465779.1 Rgg/GadR/MutR family transcriptional regulator [Streptococcus equi subsp. zooepidemicus]CAW99016.1 putative DNA-binding protein [Streptococcus equi subsp. zooepidemicus]HEK9954960.1 Rgg/GadR/MutR family transcriptional regulator [Streptococcus equi subsp. zooepidemicus]HEK9993820.1 Rgg/GadR/MutR family transcriptional regulator [Streptococcus equi subsp. zooepidemicus]
MQYMGEMFKLLRTSRHISLKEATGDAFSHSMLSRFENGESDITISKLLVGLSNIRTELNEFVYLANGFKPSPYAVLKQEIWEAISKKDLSSLHQLYTKELEQYHLYKKDIYFLNALMIKSQMLFLDENIKMTPDEQSFLYDYLFSVEIWGIYELQLFSDISPLLSLDVYLRYTREMLGRVDFFEELWQHRNLVHSILLNGLFKATQEKRLGIATYFDNMINNHFFEENDTYLRIVYMIADGQHLYCKGEKELGLKQINDAIHILKALNCDESAAYYSDSLEKWLKEVE